jgi:hypothetical protein
MSTKAEPRRGGDYETDEEPPTPFEQFLRTLSDKRRASWEADYAFDPAATLDAMQIELKRRQTLEEDMAALAARLFRQSEYDDIQSRAGGAAWMLCQTMHALDARPARMVDALILPTIEREYTYEFDKWQLAYEDDRNLLSLTGWFVRDVPDGDAQGYHRRGDGVMERALGPRSNRECVLAQGADSLLEQVVVQDTDAAKAMDQRATLAWALEQTTFRERTLRTPHMERLLAYGWKRGEQEIRFFWSGVGATGRPWQDVLQALPPEERSRHATAWLFQLLYTAEALGPSGGQVWPLARLYAVNVTGTAYEGAEWLYRRETNGDRGVYSLARDANLYFILRVGLHLEEGAPDPKQNLETLAKALADAISTRLPTTLDEDQWREYWLADTDTSHDEDERTRPYLLMGSCADGDRLVFDDEAEAAPVDDEEEAPADDDPMDVTQAPTLEYLSADGAHHVELNLETGAYTVHRRGAAGSAPTTKRPPTRVACEALRQTLATAVRDGHFRAPVEGGSGARFVVGGRASYATDLPEVARQLLAIDADLGTSPGALTC